MTVGRTRQIDDELIAEIDRMRARGYTLREIAAKTGISVTSVRNNLSLDSAEVRRVAEKITEAEAAFNELSTVSQLACRDLADELRLISFNLAGAAGHGSFTAFRLSALAARQVGKVDADDPMANPEVLQAISALTKMSNDAAYLSVQLIQAHKDRIPKDTGSEEIAVITHRIVDPQQEALDQYRNFASGD